MLRTVTPALSHRRLWLYFFLGAAVALGAIRLQHRATYVPLKPVASRKPIGALQLPLLNGGTWSLAEHRGQVVLINYWATWCEPCQEEVPALLRASREYDPARFAMVGISLDSGPDMPAHVRQFVASFRVPYPIAFPGETLGIAATQIALPTTVLIDRQGRLARTYTGPVETKDLARDIAALLAET